MIRVQCPGCDSKLAIKDIYAGKLILCPKCKNKMRLPELETEDEDEAREERISAASRVESPPRRPRRRVEEDDEEDERPVRPRRRRIDDDDEERSEHITEDERPARPRRRRINDDEDRLEVDEPRPRRRKERKRRRRREAEGWSISDVNWTNWLLIGLGIVALLGFASVAAAFAFPLFMIIPVCLGGLLMFVGYVWFVIVAFQDDAIQGVLCMLIGIYRVYYLITNFDEVKIPFLIEVVGAILFVGGICAGGGFNHPR
jgi:hypothetical protein